MRAVRLGCRRPPHLARSLVSCLVCVPNLVFLSWRAAMIPRVPNNSRLPTTAKTPPVTGACAQVLLCLCLSCHSQAAKAACLSSVCVRALYIKEKNLKKSTSTASSAPTLRQGCRVLILRSTCVTLRSCGENNLVSSLSFRL